MSNELNVFLGLLFVSIMVTLIGTLKKKKANNHPRYRLMANIAWSDLCFSFFRNLTPRLSIIPRAPKTSKEEIMIRKSAMLFFLGGALLVLLTLIFYTGANQIPETVRMPVALIIPIIVLFGMVIGCHFARQNYLGRVLELNQLEEGEYECNKNTGWMISLKETYEKEKLNPRFILVRKPPSIDEIPLGMDFTLTVSTESGKETRSGEKKPERFTRRLFKARWKNPEAKGGLAETRWSTDVK